MSGGQYLSHSSPPICLDSDVFRFAEEKEILNNTKINADIFWCFDSHTS